MNYAVTLMFNEIAVFEHYVQKIAKVFSLHPDQNHKRNVIINIDVTIVSL